MKNLRILASHPVQYHVPFYRTLAEGGVSIEVCYYHAGAAGRVGHDLEFGLDIQWDIDLLGGYPYRTLIKGTAEYTLAEQFRYIFRLAAWVLKERTPILLMGWFIESVWLVWALALLLRIPALVLSETTPQSYAAGPKPKSRTRLLSRLLTRTQAGLYVGTKNRYFLSSMGVPENRLFPVPYSVDNARFSSEAERLLPQRSVLCARYGLDAEMPVFLFCGKLIPKKRPLDLLEAYQAAGLSDKAQLIFVGDGLLRPQLEDRVRKLGLKHVHVLGFFNQSQMPLAYVLGEILCLVSDATETWGLVVNEALACGRPVIVSDTLGCAPDLVDEENGWVVPLDDREKLTRTLGLAFANYPNWVNMGNAGRARVAGNTFASMADGVALALRTIQPDFVRAGIRLT